MTRKHHDGTPVARFLNLIEHKLHARNIQGVCRLIEHQDIGLLHYGAGDAQPLLHAKGVLAVLPLVIRVESHLANCLSHLVSSYAPPDRGEKLEVLKTRVAPKKSGTLEQQADRWSRDVSRATAPRMGPGVDPVDGHLAACGLHEAHKHAHEHRLAATVGTYQARHLARKHLQGNVIEHRA